MHQSLIQVQKGNEMLNRLVSGLRCMKIACRVVGLLGAIAKPSKSEDKYVGKVLNWSEVHLSEMTCYKIHNLKKPFTFVPSYFSS